MCACCCVCVCRDYTCGFHFCAHVRGETGGKEETSTRGEEERMGGGREGERGIRLQCGGGVCK